MLQLSATILNQPILSLRTGRTVAIAKMPIFNPTNLKIEGFYCEDSHDKSQLILLYQDIREVIKEGFVVNDHGVLVEADELVRLKDTLELQFELMGKHVQTVSGDKLGKVSDYAVETQTMFVQKLYVSQSVLRNFAGGSLSIDRNQINEITERRIIVNDLLQKAPLAAAAAA